MAGGGRGYFAGIEIEEEFLGSPKALLGMTRRQKNEILRVRHVLGPHECVKFFPRKVAELHACLAQTEIFVVRFLGDGCGLIVADARGEGRHEHQRIHHVEIDLFPIDFDSSDAMFDKTPRRIGEEPDGV